jgi:probable rRNA maturation factor
MDATIDISVNCDAWHKGMPGIEGRVRMAVQAALSKGIATLPSEWPRRSPEVSILLSDDSGVRALNNRYRHIDRATNVLAFPIDSAETPDTDTCVHTLGDIVLAFETVTAEAASQGKAFDNHLTHLVVHGLLHLLGHDHELDKDAQVMEALEVAILAGLGISDPYESPVKDAGCHD